MYQRSRAGVPARPELLGGVLLLVGHVQVLAPRRRRAPSGRLAGVAVERVGRVRVERGLEVLGVRADALGLRGEVMSAHSSPIAGQREGLAGEAGARVPLAIQDARQK